MMFQTTVADLIVENGEIKGVRVKEAKYVDDEDHETDSVDAVSIFGLRTNLSEDEVRSIFHNITENLLNEISLWGYYTIQVDNQDTDCQDMRHLDLDCFNDIDNTTRSVSILYDASESDSLAYHQRNLQGMLDRSIDRAKASHYGL